MLDHVHYEVQQLMMFAARGNRDETEQVVRNSLLEAGLLHIRCIIEFLGEKKGDRVSARDYLDWDWRPDRELMRMDQLDGRLAHIGLVRATPDFRWDVWMNEQLPRVLSVFAQWLAELRGISPDRYKLFAAARPGRLCITPEALDPTLR
jgi:hypothetical protein